VYKSGAKSAFTISHHFLTTAMFLLIPSLLLAGAVSAQITTSIPLPEKNLGTDKIGFYGSVIGASNGHTTMVISYDNGTNLEALSYGDIKVTITVSPNSYEFNQNLRRGIPNDGSPDGPDGSNINQRCSIENGSQQCIFSYGTLIASSIQCETEPSRQEATGYQTYTHTYPGRLSYSAGVETFTRTIIHGPQSSRSPPSWCTESGHVFTSAYLETVTMSSGALGMYQVVLTAGLEKLSATQGASATSSGATPTASGGADTSGAAGISVAAGSTGAAGPMKTAGPVLVGLGAAAAMFL
jgi:hypothetical protein